MMPKIDLTPVRQELTAMTYAFINAHTKEIEIVTGIQAAEGIIATQGKNKGCLRAAKPALETTIISREFTYDPGEYGTYRSPSLVTAASAQVWRYVAFEASPIGQHHCLPVMAAYDCPFDMSVEELNKFAHWCEAVADVVLKTIKHKPGLDRWGHAFGYL